MRRFRLRTLRFILGLLLLGVLAAIILRWVSLERWHFNLERAAAAPDRSTHLAPTPSPSPTRPPVIGGKLETARLFSGITVNSKLELAPGARRLRGAAGSAELCPGIDPPCAGARA